MKVMEQLSVLVSLYLMDQVSSQNNLSVVKFSTSDIVGLENS